MVIYKFFLIIEKVRWMLIGVHESPSEVVRIWPDSDQRKKGVKNLRVRTH